MLCKALRGRLHGRREGPVETDVSEIQIGVTEGNNLFNVLVRFFLKVHRTDSGKETTEPTVEMSCRFVLIYFLKSMEGIDEANLIAFGELAAFSRHGHTGESLCTPRRFGSVSRP